MCAVLKSQVPLKSLKVPSRVMYWLVDLSFSLMSSDFLDHFSMALLFKAGPKSAVYALAQETLVGE